MAYGELFRHFTIRFSLKKAQHVKLLQLFEDKKLTAGWTKNQLVMDALEMFFDIMPSSIHEVVAVPSEMVAGNLTHLTEMVHDINMGELELEERLSNSVYHYDRNARKVTLAAESPEKRLDGKTTELPLIQEDKRQR